MICEIPFETFKNIVEEFKLKSPDNKIHYIEDRFVYVLYFYTDFFIYSSKIAKVDLSDVDRSVYIGGGIKCLATRT